MVIVGLAARVAKVCQSSLSLELSFVARFWFSINPESEPTLALFLGGTAAVIVVVAVHPPPAVCRFSPFGIPHLAASAFGRIRSSAFTTGYFESKPFGRDADERASHSLDLSARVVVA